MFRRKSQIKGSELNETLAKFTEGKGTRQKEVGNLCLLAGRTLLACALAEELIYDVLRHIGNEGFNFEKWMQKQEVRRRFSIDQDFFDDLQRFRICRNRFVHGIWGISRARLTTKKGRLETAEFIQSLCYQARALIDVFQPALLNHHRRILGWSDHAGLWFIGCPNITTAHSRRRL